MSDITFELGAASGDDVSFDIPATVALPVSSDDVTVGAESLTDYLAGLGGGGADHTVGLFAADIDAAGGSFTEVTILGSSAIPRSYVVGASMLVTEGDDYGIWTITASGPCTPGAALAPADVIASENGRIAVAYTADGTTVAGVYAHPTVTTLGELETVLSGEIDALQNDVAALDTRADALEVDVAALEVDVAALEAAELVVAEARGRLSTDPTFALCAPLINGDHHDYAWQIATPPGDFTTGSYVRFDDLVVLPLADPASPSSDRVYSELATQTGDDGTVGPVQDPGVFDIREDAVERRWDADARCWRSSLYFEWTEIGGTVEAHTISTAGTYDLPDGVPGTYARWLEFSNGGNWRLRWFRRVWRETPTDTFDGADWVQIMAVNGTGTTNIATGITHPWGYGYGQGPLRYRKVTERDVGPAGTILAELDAADAAAGGDLAFTDGAGNTVTPGAEAATYTPTTGGGAVDSVNGETGTVVLTAADVGADPAGTAAALVDDLSGVTNTSTARSNLGLGTAATTAASDYATAAHNHAGVYDPAGSAATAQAAAIAASQPADADLTAIAALTTTTYGRSLLTQADAATARTNLGVAYGLTAGTVAQGDSVCHATWRAGSYYGTSVPRIVNAGQTVASGQVKAMAFYNPVSGRTFDQLAVDVQAGSAGSGILYVCSDTGAGYPGGVLFSAAMSTPTTSTRSTGSVSGTLPVGLLWFVAHGTGTTWSGLSLDGQSPYLPVAATYAVGAINCWNATGAGTSTLTAFPAGASIASTGVQVLIRAS